jgi:hypothetical protein
LRRHVTACHRKRHLGGGLGHPDQWLPDRRHRRRYPLGDRRSSKPTTLRSSGMCRRASRAAW